MATARDLIRARHELRHTLHKLRANVGLSQRDVAEHLGCSESKVRRIEYGQVRVDRVFLLALLNLYQVDETQRAPLVQLVRLSGQQPYSQYVSVLTADALACMRYELLSDHLQFYAPTALPELLQTPAYARRLLTRQRHGITPEDLLLRLEAHRERQIAVFAGEPRMTIVLGEAVLRRPVAPGAEGEAVMEEQLAHLDALGSSPAVELHVLRLDRLLPEGVSDQPFTIFTGGEGLALVHTTRENAERRLKEDPDDVRRHQVALANLVEVADRWSRPPSSGGRAPG